MKSELEQIQENKKDSSAGEGEGGEKKSKGLKAVGKLSGIVSSDVADKIDLAVDAIFAVTETVIQSGMQQLKNKVQSLYKDISDEIQKRVAKKHDENDDKKKDSSKSE